MCPQDDNNYLGDPIPFDDNSEIVPLDRADGPTPIGSGQSGKLKPIPIGDDDLEVAGTAKIQTFASKSKLDSTYETKFKREMNTTGTGATRVRTFHVKLTDGAFHYLDSQINEWVDQTPGVEVKFCNTTIGIVEGKRPEPHVIMNVWY